MDAQSARFAVLKLATVAHPEDDSDGQLTIAKKWADFVVGEKHIESKSQREPKGLDDPK